MVTSTTFTESYPWELEKKLNEFLKTLRKEEIVSINYSSVGYGSSSKYFSVLVIYERNTEEHHNPNDDVMIE